MNIANFKSKYGLDLIPVSNEGIMIGTLVWDPLIGSPRFAHKGMPSNIFQTFLDAGLLDKISFEDWIEKCKNTPLQDAEIANFVVDIEVDTAAALNIPFGDFTNDFNFQKIKKYEFGQVKSKLMTFDIRIELDSLLEKMRLKKWKEYDGQIRRLFVVKELYYGTSVRITFESKFEEEFKAKAKTHGVKVNLALSGTTTKTYEFTNKKVPFAMRTSSVKHFNG